jgi:hypothetical protein
VAGLSGAAQRTVARFWALSCGDAAGISGSSSARIALTMPPTLKPSFELYLYLCSFDRI